MTPPIGATNVAPRISVVIPCFNAQPYLAEAIESALTQSRPPYEVIVQDGASTDGTLDVLRGMGSSVKWFSQPDSGQSEALNRAIQRSSGDVVGWLNADDAYLDGALECVAQAFVADPLVDMVFGDFQIVGGAGNVLRRYRSNPYSWHRIFARGNYIFSGATFFRRRILDRVGPFDTTLQCCMDLDYFLRLPEGLRSAHVALPVAVFRMHRMNKSTKLGWKFVAEALRVRLRHARHSRALQVLAYVIAVRHFGYQYTSRFRYSRAWSRIRGERAL